MRPHRDHLGHYLRRASLIAPVLLAACCPGSRYLGDGQIASEACWPFSNYSVTFTRLSTGTAQSRKYFIHSLPDLDSVVGFKVITPRPLYCEQFKRASAAKAVVALRLTSTGGQDVVQHRAALSDWTWSYGGSPNPPRPWEPDQCFLYAPSLYFDPGLLRDLTLQITIEQQSESPIELTPTVQSYAMHAP
jgi:hypothetical protein